MDGAARSGSSTARADRRGAHPREDQLHRAGPGQHHPRAFRDDAVAAIGVQNLIDVRSPDEYAVGLHAPGPPPAGAGPARRPRADLAHVP